MSIISFEINKLSNPKEREKLLGVLRECDEAMTRIDAERDFIKEAVASIAEELLLPKQLVSKMVKIYHKRNFDEEVRKHEQFETLYESIIENK